MKVMIDAAKNLNPEFLGATFSKPSYVAFNKCDQICYHVTNMNTCRIFFQILEFFCNFEKRQNSYIITYI